MTIADPDAAFFEDWEEWRELDGLPPQPMITNQYGVVERQSRDLWRHPRYSKYYCHLHLRCSVLGGAPGFEFNLPSSHPIQEMVRRLPEARLHPRITAPYPDRTVAQSGLRNMRWVPATQWRAVRRILPALKQAVSSYVRTPR